MSGSFANLYPKVIEGRSMGGQAGFMFAAVLVAFTISVAGGAITGMFKIRPYSTKLKQKSKLCRGQKKRLVAWIGLIHCHFI